MGTIGVQFDFAEFHRRERASAKHATHTRKWTAAQTTNVVAEARDRATPPARLDELARNGTAPVRIGVAGNPSADPATLVFLTGRDFITSEIAQRLTRNPATPLQALKNVQSSTFATWHGNRERILAHPNWAQPS